MIRWFASLALAAGSLAAQPAEYNYISTPSPANTFLFSKNGATIVVASDDNKVRVWSLADHKLQREFDLAERHFDSAALSDDGATLVLADRDGLVTVCNTATGAERIRVKMPRALRTLALSGDGRRLALAPLVGPVDIYDVTSGNKLFELSEALGGTNSVVFSKDLELIGAGDAATTVRVFDGRSGSLLDRNNDFLLEAFAVAFTPDRKLLFAAGADKVILTIDIATGEVIHRSEKTADPVGALDVSPDGKFVTAAMLHATNMNEPAPVAIYDSATGKQVQEWKPSAVPLGGGWTSDGHLICAIATQDTVRLWRIR